MFKKLLVLLLVVSLLVVGFVVPSKAVNSVSVSATPNTAGSVAAFTISFMMQNALAPSGSIIITFPSGFTVPQGSWNTNYLQVNGAPPTSVSASGQVVTIVPSQQGGLAAGYVRIFISNTVGVKNPSTGGSYSITISTSTSGEPIGTGTLTIASAVTGVYVSVNPLLAGTKASYIIQFTPNIALVQNTDYIYIEFPAGTTLPTPVPNNVLFVGNSQVPSTYISYPSSTKMQIKVPISLNASVVQQVYIPDTFGIINTTTSNVPLTIKVSTSKETAPVDSNPFKLIGTSVSSPKVTVSPDSASSVAAYTIQFLVSPTGGLSPTTDYIKIEFGEGTTLPANTNPSYISINGVSCSNRLVSGNTLTVYMPSTLTINGGQYVIVQISSNFGIVNPSTPGTYALKISTSKDIIPVQAYYTITGTSISNLDITVDPPTQNSNAQYTITFKTSSSGALSRSASDKIYVTFPTGFTVPNSISASYITVNGTQCTTSITNTNGKLTITTPIDIGANSSVTVVISKNANIINPPTAQTYQIKVSTSKDVVEVSDSIDIVKSTVSKPQVQLTSYAISDNVGITITFNTGSGGVLTTSDTISIVFPSQFTLPSSISTNYVKVNNYNALQVIVSGFRLDIKPYANIGANSQVTVVIDKSAGIKNPTQSGDYKVSVYTSKETTPVDSDTFKIVILPTTTATVSPSQPDGENGYYKTTPRVTLAATSPVDMYPQIYYYIDSASPQLYSAPITIPDGIHTLYFYAKDKYGNSEIPKSMQFKVDTVKPTITITSPQNNAILNTKDITIKGTVSEQATLTINGVSVPVKPDLTFEYSTTIIGKTTFTIIAKDVAGNISETTLTVSLDTTPPKLTIIKPVAFQTVNVPYVDVEGITDADAVKVTVNGQNVQVGGDFKFTYRVTLTTEGLNSIDVIAEDLAGNQARQVITVNYVKKTKLILQVDNKNAILNDKAIQLDAAPKIVNGRTLVPIRTIGTVFNAEITWEPVFRLVIIKLGDSIIYLQIGVNYASVNGKKVMLDVSPQIINKYTYVPLRFISESLNASVEWDGATKTIIIIYPK
ncbi:stalk domain-containing protein [Caldisericum exile]|uniref:stalk domain-containing protein n=1 Tax=Caldisericum exile TaxID=693075 RepID=UPI003C7521BA